VGYRIWISSGQSKRGLVIGDAWKHAKALIKTEFTKLDMAVIGSLKSRLSMYLYQSANYRMQHEPYDENYQWKELISIDKMISLIDGTEIKCEKTDDFICQNFYESSKELRNHGIIVLMHLISESNSILITYEYCNS